MPAMEVPHRSTVFDILKRNGLVKKKRRRTRWLHPGAAPLRTAAANEVWTTGPIDPCEEFGGGRFEVIVLDRDLSIGGICPALAPICALKRAIRGHRMPPQQPWGGAGPGFR
jgi:hypothetical protein